jgi:hypothetical protein
MLRRLLIVASLSGILGWSVGWLQFYGYLTPWSRLQNAPFSIATLVQADGSTVYAQAVDGTIYSCSFWDSSCWNPAILPIPKDPSEIVNLKLCIPTDPAFTFTTAPPPKMHACVASQVIYADGSGEYRFVLTDDQQVWHWEHVHSAYDRPLMIFTILGVCAGLLIIGIIIGLRYVRKQLTQR